MRDGEADLSLGDETCMMEDGGMVMDARSLRATSSAPQWLTVAVTLLLLTAGPTTAQYDGYMTSLLQICNGAGCSIPLGAHDWQDDLIGGESVTDPAVNDTLAVGGTKYVWESVLDADGLWEIESGNAVVYLSTCIVATSPGPIRIRYRHTAGLKAWIYGHLLIDEAGGHGGAEELSEKSVFLPDGKVRLLFKLQGTAGLNSFGAKVTDSSGSDLPFVIYDNTAGGTDPAGMIVILAPQGCRTFQIGQQLTVRWIADLERLSAPVAVRLSVNNGRSWSDISDQIQSGDPAFYDRDTGTLVWTIQDSVWLENTDARVSTLSQTCKIRVFSQYDPNYPAVNTETFTINQASAARGLLQNRRSGIMPDVRRKAMGGTVVDLPNQEGYYRIETLDMLGRSVWRGNGVGPARVALPTATTSAVRVIRVDVVGGIATCLVNAIH